jgi:hypothetical protein
MSALLAGLLGLVKSSGGVSLLTALLVKGLDFLHDAAKRTKTPVDDTAVEALDAAIKTEAAKR